MNQVKRVFRSKLVWRNVHRTFSFNQKSTNQHLNILPSVEEALKSKKSAVVALESTIITHGMPYPENIQTALEVEEVVRFQGAVPATIGVVDGTIHIGMDKSTMHKMASCENALKLSRHNLAEAVSKTLSGGTTVAATMMLAKQCGIEVFVTGGIGGVHKGGHHSMDISCDLRELGRNDVTVVCAGVKSILDIGRTLEYMETEGVSVATFGSDIFPAFFTPSSGFKSPIRLDDVEQVTSFIRAHKNIGVGSGVLLAVPVPDHLSTSAQVVQEATDQSLREASAQNITGNDVTPFVLRRVNDITKGASLQTNISLIKHNAKIGSLIAVKMNKDEKRWKRPVVIGGSNVDVMTVSNDEEIIKFGASNRASISLSSGGVGRNIAEGLWRLEQDPFFISAVGCDVSGDFIFNQLPDMDLGGILRSKDYKTGMYITTCSRDGEVYLGMGDQNIHSIINIDLIKSHEATIKSAAVVCMDGNLPAETIKYIMELCWRNEIKVLFEPCDILKAPSAYKSGTQDCSFTFATPNLAELKAIYEEMTKSLSPLIDENELKSSKNNKSFHGIVSMCEELSDSTENMIVTLGSNGILLVNKQKKLHFPLTSMPNWDWLQQPVVNVSGAGDGFTAGLVAGLLNDMQIDQCINVGLTVAQKNLRSSKTVSREISALDLESSKSCWKYREI